MAKNLESRTRRLVSELQRLLSTTVLLFLRPETCSSDRLDVVPINSHGHRPLNRIDGNNQAVVAVLRQKHAFHSVHCSTAYPDPLPHLEEGVRTPGRRLRQDFLNAFDLLVRNRQARSARTHKTVHTLHLVDARPVLRTQSATDEH